MGLRGPAPGRNTDRVIADGEPDLPAGLSDSAAKEWFRVVEFLTDNGMVGSIDSTGLHLLVMTRERLIEAHKRLAENPGDKQRRIDVCSLTTSWLALAGKYGLTAQDRLKLRAGVPDDMDAEDIDLLGD